jgi:hypothetical protein
MIANMERTDRQLKRDNAKDSGGRFSKYPICELCAKPLHGEMYSDERCNTIGRGRGLTLHRRCAEKLDIASDVEFLSLLGVTDQSP